MESSELKILVGISDKRKKYFSKPNFNFYLRTYQSKILLTEKYLKMNQNIIIRLFLIFMSESSG